MGIFSSEKSPEEQEKKLESLRLEHEILNEESQIAERRAVISQLKRQYGKDWAKTLGISKLTDLSTLKSFLRDAKQGMKAEYYMAKSQGPRQSPPQIRTAPPSIRRF